MFWTLTFRKHPEWIFYFLIFNYKFNKPPSILLPVIIQYLSFGSKSWNGFNIYTTMNDEEINIDDFLKHYLNIFKIYNAGIMNVKM